MTVLSVTLFCCLVTPSATTGQDADLIQAVDSLRSSDFLEATEATRVLFASGREAIPYLVSGFSDTSKFIGLCGNKIRTSEVNFEPVTMGGTALDREAHVQEVSLYLLLAVLRDDLYFAEDCTVGAVAEGADRHQKISAAAGEIAVLFVSSEIGRASFSLDAVESILHQHGVTIH
jgi:hypothetical protein